MAMMLNRRSQTERFHSYESVRTSKLISGEKNSEQQLPWEGEELTERGHDGIFWEIQLLS